ncbi:MAG: alpha/beta hydrolase [Spirochaetaceae bacterium]|nr:alpha/beta hydrolase [Spirochaetaceae bacterium]
MVFELLAIILAIALFITAATVFTPYPAVYFVRWLFKQYPYVPPADYARYLENVTIERDVDYGSAYPSGLLDIIRPKNASGDEKVIFAVHGGAYISEGDKTEFYYVMLANEGFVTVNVKYAIAPEKARYPVPVKQLEEAYAFIRDHRDQYRLNLDKVFFSGDSAGAQIAGQFVAMQTNPAYMETMNGISRVRFSRLVPQESIDGAVLLCAVYDFLRLDPPPKNTMKLPMKKLALAYFGVANTHSRLIASAGLFDKITGDFPRTFITDANTYSFEFEAKEMVNILASKNIPVTSVFYDAAAVSLQHNYQFHLEKPQGYQTYQKLAQFLKQ